MTDNNIVMFYRIVGKYLNNNIFSVYGTSYSYLEALKLLDKAINNDNWLDTKIEFRPELPFKDCNADDFETIIICPKCGSVNCSVTFIASLDYWEDDRSFITYKCNDCLYEG